MMKAPRELSRLLMSALLLVSTGISRSSAEDVVPVRETPHAVKDVLVLLDTSGSMEGDRIARAKESIAVLLSILPDGTRFTLKLFSHETSELTRQTVLSPKSRRAIFDLLATVKPGGGTDMLTPIEKVIHEAPTESVVIILGDGQQAPQGKNVPEAEWRNYLSDLIRQAKLRHLRFFSIALGDGADRALLGRVADETGGEFYAVAKPDDLLESFTKLASLFGRFMFRSTPGEFSISEEQDVIAVFQTRDNPEHFLKSIGSDGTRNSVVPAVTLRFEGIVAVRFRLAAGRYEFDPPAGSRYTSLLKPMPFTWPNLTSKVEAARKSHATIRASAKSDSSSFDGLTLVGVNNELPAALRRVEGTADSLGVIRMPLPLPSEWIGKSLEWPLEVEQRGWHVSLSDRLRVNVVRPLPVDVRVEIAELVAGQNSNAIKYESVSGDATTDSRTLKLSALAGVSDVDGSLEVSIETGSDIELLAPTKFSVTSELQTHEFILRRRHLRPGLATALLTVRVRSDDPAEWTINGGDSVTCPIHWRVTQPTVTIDLPKTIHVGSIPRGRSTSFAIGITTSELNRLSGRPVELLFSADKTPAGIDVVPKSDSTTAVSKSGKHAVILPAGQRHESTRLPLTLSISTDVLPGTYQIPVSFSLSDERALLNGGTQPVSTSIELIVPPVSVLARMAELGGDGREKKDSPLSFIVSDMLNGEKFAFAIDVIAVDGGLVPETSPKWVIDDGFQIRLTNHESVSKVRTRLHFELEVPPKCQPGLTTASLELHGDVLLTHRPSLSVTIPGVLIDPNPTPVNPDSVPLLVKKFTIFRYPKSIEPYLGWLREKDVELELSIDNAELWSRINARWRLEAQGSSGQRVSILANDGQGRFIATAPRRGQSLRDWILRIETGYPHVQLARSRSDSSQPLATDSRPGSSFDLALVPEVQIIPLPPWVVGIMCALAVFIIVAPIVWKNRPFAVEIDDVPVSRRFRALRVGNDIRLSRSFCGPLAIRLARGKPSQASEVTIERAESADGVHSPRESLSPGARLCLYPGDIVTIPSDGGLSSMITVTKAPRQRISETPSHRDDFAIEEFDLPELSSLRR